MTTLILLAGGIGKRANLGLPKQYYRIEEKMIIEYTLENVSKVGGIDRLILVSNPQFMDTALELAESFPKIETVTIGGRLGTNQCTTDLRKFHRERPRL